MHRQAESSYVNSSFTASTSKRKENKRKKEKEGRMEEKKKKKKEEWKKETETEKPTANSMNEKREQGLKRQTDRQTDRERGGGGGGGGDNKQVIVKILFRLGTPLQADLSKQREQTQPNSLFRACRIACRRSSFSFSNYPISWT